MSTRPRFRGQSGGQVVEAKAVDFVAPISPPCEGGARGGGPGSTRHLAFRSVEAPMRARIRVVFESGGQRLTPPSSPFKRGGKLRSHAAFFAMALGFALTGCASKTATPVIAKPVAPVRTKPVEAASLPPVKFVNVTKESGINFVHVSGAAGEKLLPETMGSGVAFFDYDNDGDADLFFVNSDEWPAKDGKRKNTPTQALYRNDGKGHFENVSKAAGLDKSFFGQGVAVGDYDNDGDLDLYVTAVGGGHLFRNDGGTFKDVTVETNSHASQGWLTSACFLDIENDGDLDLFVGCYLAWTEENDRGQSFTLTGGKQRAYGRPSAFNGTFCTLLRNDSGKFTDISEPAGINVRTPDLKVPVAKALGVAPCDVNGDGLVDIAVANDTVPNFLFKNLGRGKFELVGTSGIEYDQLGSARGAMGIDWGDFKNDGSLGLAIGNFANEMTALYHSDDPKTFVFSDVANVYGLGAPTQPPLKFGLFFFDYDLDGRLDLLMTNGHLESDIQKVQASETYAQSAQLFWNTGKPGRTMFALVGPEVAGKDLFDPIVGRGSAYADIDGDGDLDVVFTENNGPARLFRNDGGNDQQWIRLKLVGKTSNRDGIGAKVSLTAGGMTQRKQLFPAKGYLSSVELPLTFGLGNEAKADVVSIVWPSGEKTELKDVAAGKVYTVEEGKGVR